LIFTILGINFGNICHQLYHLEGTMVAHAHKYLEASRARSLSGSKSAKSSYHDISFVPIVEMFFVMACLFSFFSLVIEQLQ